ncbi:hypothetical protein BH11BAC2_BH11BAC2_00520 [soil metagenome]
MKTTCCNSKSSLLIGSTHVCMNATCNNYLAPVSMRRDFRRVRTQLAVSLFAFQMLWPNDEVIKAGSLITINPPVHLNLSVAFSEDELKKQLILEKVICPDEVFAQMKLESASFSSPLYKKTKNLMGMRYSFRRPTKASGIYLPDQDTIIYTDNQKEVLKYAERNHYAVYDSWQDAVKDYQLWQEYNFKMTDRYLNFLGEVYAEDLNYISKIKSITKKSLKSNSSKIHDSQPR